MWKAFISTVSILWHISTLPTILPILVIVINSIIYTGSIIIIAVVSVIIIVSIHIDIIITIIV